jgi:hypothetical protein
VKEIITTPIEVTRAVANMAADGGRSILHGLGEDLVRRTQPDYVPPEVQERQAVLKRFEDRFAVVGNLMERDLTAQEMETRMSWIAYELVDEGVADEDTCIELRPLLPEDTFYDTELNARREMVVTSLSVILKRDYGVQSIYNSHPITPSDHEDSPIDVTAAWGSIATEMEGLSHQVGQGPEKKVAMLAITNRAYEEKVFGLYIVGNNARATRDELAILRHVGSTPEENLLLGRRQAGVLEHRELSDFRTPSE